MVDVDIRIENEYTCDLNSLKNVATKQDQGPKVSTKVGDLHTSEVKKKKTALPAT